MILGKRSKDLTGQTFGSLTAIKPLRIHNGMTHWLFNCVCGKEFEARGNTVVHQAKLIAGAEYPSCGCKELEHKTKHGYRKAEDTHATYRAYRGMMSRCYSSGDTGYKWYGAMGVTVCAEWRNNPEAFIEWSLSNGWQPRLHIDKDVLCEAKGIHPHIYSPETCQWVSAKVNVGFATNRDNFGKHPNVRLSHAEVSQILAEYAAGGTTKSALARKFGVTPSSVNRLVRISQGKE